MRDRLYSTADLARICGVSISTIKRWTDTGLLRCARTPGGHRKFRVQDVAEAARQLGTSMAGADETSRPHAGLDELGLLLLHGNREALVARGADHLEFGEGEAIRQMLLDLHRHGMSFSEVGDQVLRAALEELRAGTRRGHVDDCVLRRAERLADAAAMHLMEQIPPPSLQAPAALVAGAPGVWDPLWPALCTLTLSELGWKVVDLGPEVPLSTLRHGLGRERPGLVVLIRAAMAETDLAALRLEAEGHGAEFLTLPPPAGTEVALAHLRQRARERERHLAASVV
ncbi:MAG: MerR family DNA-binding transcriptional regulator [Candidatus Krumholzibacteriia bacterium]